MLIYEYMPNGSLADALHGKNSFSNLLADWVIRYNIAVGIAQGLCYLHHDCSPTVIHRDVKSSNILLDSNLDARVADFGVAKLVDSNEEMSTIAGSSGYIDPGQIQICLLFSIFTRSSSHIESCCCSKRL